MKRLNNQLFIFLIMLTATVSFSACEKNKVSSPDELAANSASRQMSSDGFIKKNYTDLSFQTRWELQQARAATAKYQNINNALADGYHDIEVDVENMGHHYLRDDLVDGTFDIRHPEILVYNKDENGKQQ